MNTSTFIVYATSNKGKVKEIGRHFGFYDLKPSFITDFLPDAKLDPDETGTSLGENATIKARAYAEALSNEASLRGKKFIVFADDTGVFIKGLNGEPGIRVRRWIGRKMTDEEIIDHCISLLEGMTGDDRKAEFKTVLCMITVDEKGNISEPSTVEGSLKGHIVEAENVDKRRIEGFPFESLFWVDDYDMILGDLHHLPDEKKRGGMFNHRERAIEKAIPLIKGMM